LKAGEVRLEILSAAGFSLGNLRLILLNREFLVWSKQILKLNFSSVYSITMSDEAIYEN